MGVDLKVLEYVLILEVMPIIAVGFIRHKGLPFEKYARIMLNHRFGEKRLLYKTDAGNLPSLYPVTPDRRTEGADRREITQKERRRRRKAQRECLQGDPAARGRRRRPRPARNRPREAARGAQAPAVLHGHQNRPVGGDLLRRDPAELGDGRVHASDQVVCASGPRVDEDVAARESERGGEHVELVGHAVPVRHADGLLLVELELCAADGRVVIHSAIASLRTASRKGPSLSSEIS